MRIFGARLRRLSQQYIVALNNIHFGSQLSPNTGLGYDGRLNRVSSAGLILRCVKWNRRKHS
jgi:hypothetical protein